MGKSTRHQIIFYILEKQAQRKNKEAQASSVEYNKNLELKDFVLTDAECPSGRRVLNTKIDLKGMEPTGKTWKDKPVKKPVIPLKYNSSG